MANAIPAQSRATQVEPTVEPKAEAKAGYSTLSQAQSAIDQARAAIKSVQNRIDNRIYELRNPHKTDWVVSELRQMECLHLQVIQQALKDAEL